MHKLVDQLRVNLHGVWNELTFLLWGPSWAAFCNCWLVCNWTASAEFFKAKFSSSEKKGHQVLIAQHVRHLLFRPFPVWIWLAKQWRFDIKFFLFLNGMPFQTYKFYISVMYSSVLIMQVCTLLISHYKFNTYGIVVFIIENGFGNLSSSPEKGYLHFI